MLGFVDKLKGLFALLAIFGQDVRASRRKTLITIIVCALGCTAFSAFVLKRLQQKQLQSTPSSRSLKGTNNTKFTNNIKGLKITISTLGVVLKKNTSPKSNSKFDVIPSGSSAIIKLIAQNDVYLITRVDSDEEQREAMKLLDESGVLWAGLPIHKVLFCGTAEGRIHMTRQLDSQLHIDGNVCLFRAHLADDAKVINSLQPFVPNLLHVGNKDTINTTNQAPNISTTSDLSQFLLSL